MNILQTQITKFQGKEVKVVSVEGAIKDWVAYVGSVIDSDIRVASSGSKLCKEDATNMFPLLNPSRYRR